ncbi:MAG: class I SAM-dependent methyltransferase [Dehalococcoidia bacterium]|nr:class I SAM-dependent methyltransferase [Dehalococcoidia bacterium]
MKNYEDPQWAEIYDLLHGEDDVDVDFYLSEARRAGGPVLDVACGTGRILLRLLERAIDVTGIDISQPMLDRLKEKARRSSLEARVTRADMRDFSLPERFRLIIVPFRSFMHLESKEDQLAALTCFRKHLAPNGRLALNLFVPSADTLAADGVGLRLSRELIDPDSGQRFKTWLSVSNDSKNQRQTIEWAFKGLVLGDDCARARSLSLTLRWIYQSEFESLLKTAGYSHWKVFGGFHGEPLAGEGQEMVWIAIA